MEGLFRAKRKDNGDWINGSYYEHLPPLQCCITPEMQEEKSKHYILKTGFADWNMDRGVNFFEIDIETLGQNISFDDKNGIEIFKGDITKLELPSGEIRYFEVDIRNVIRHVVNHPGFVDDTSKVVIRSVVFIWEGFELFPCVDENGIWDVSKMEVVGNKWDNPELIKGTR